MRRAFYPTACPLVLQAGEGAAPAGSFSALLFLATFCRRNNVGGSSLASAGLEPRNALRLDRLVQSAPGGPKPAQVLNETAHPAGRPGPLGPPCCGCERPELRYGGFAPRRLEIVFLAAGLRGEKKKGKEEKSNP